MPEISIIVPYYNEDFIVLNECINSILSQSFQDFEIIIVDDGSTKEKQDLIIQLESLDSRITIVTQVNSGVSVARNTGVSIARGQYIAFVDADDVTLPYYFEEALEIAHTTNADVIYGLARRTVDASFFPFRKELPNVRCVDIDWIKRYMVGDVYGNDAAYLGRGPWAKLIRTEIAKRVDFPVGVPIGEDVLWNLAIAEQTKKVYLVEQIWYYYMIRDNSVTQKYNVNIEKKVLPFYDHIERHLTNSSLDKRWYYNRIFGDLRRYIFDAYLGNIHNKDGVFRRWFKFCSICKHEPWNKIGDVAYFKVASFKERIKIITFRSRIIFFVWKLL